MNDFIKICVDVNPDIREAVANYLFESGAAGLVEDNNELHAYFDHSFDEDLIISQIMTYLTSLRDLLDSGFDIVVSSEKVPHRDWNAEWKSSLQPIAITDNILIKPTWVDAPDPHPPIIIEIDPEMAFGSGEHSTTKLTLQLIEEHLLPESRVLDIGTGTGILAIGALKLGASQVIGFDIEAVAAHTAFRNAEKNGVSDRFQSYAGTLDAIPNGPFDMITANVNRLQIIKMLPHMYNVLADDGVCLISGILDIEEQMIINACLDHHLVVKDVRREQEWLAFETRKR